MLSEGLLMPKKIMNKVDMRPIIIVDNYEDGMLDFDRTIKKGIYDAHRLFKIGNISNTIDIIWALKGMIENSHYYMYMWEVQAIFFYVQDIVYYFPNDVKSEEFVYRFGDQWFPFDRLYQDLIHMYKNWFKYDMMAEYLEIKRLIESFNLIIKFKGAFVLPELW